MLPEEVVMAMSSIDVVPLVFVVKIGNNGWTLQEWQSFWYGRR
jgi:hypothetical protein